MVWLLEILRDLLLNRISSPLGKKALLSHFDPRAFFKAADDQVKLPLTQTSGPTRFKAAIKASASDHIRQVYCTRGR